MTKAADHKTPAEIIAEMIRERISNTIQEKSYKSKKFFHSLLRATPWFK